MTPHGTSCRAAARQPREKSVQAATDFAHGVVRDATNGLNAAGNGIVNVDNQIGNGLGGLF